MGPILHPMNYTKELMMQTNNKKQVTIRLDVDVISYFKSMANSVDIPYQSLINMYLKQCANEKKQLEYEFNKTS